MANSEDLKRALAGDKNLRWADLREAGLHEADLHEADLHEADLRGADLHEADLHEADLRGADLRGADLREADLREADLHEADLRGADLHEADLRGADLHEADLRQTGIVRAYSTYEFSRYPDGRISYGCCTYTREEWLSRLPAIARKHVPDRADEFMREVRALVAWSDCATTLREEDRRNPLEVLTIEELRAELARREGGSMSDRRRPPWVAPGTMHRADPAWCLMDNAQVSVPVVHAPFCYICRDPEYAQMGLPLCYACSGCGGHVPADDIVCTDCGAEQGPEVELARREGGS